MEETLILELKHRRYGNAKDIINCQSCRINDIIFLYGDLDEMKLAKVPSDMTEKIFRSNINDEIQCSKVLDYMLFIGTDLKEMMERIDRRCVYGVDFYVYDSLLLCSLRIHFAGHCVYDSVRPASYSLRGPLR